MACDPQSTSPYALACVDASQIGCVSELCHIPAETLGQHRHLRGHAEADRCWGKSLIGSALVGFSVRQHAWAGSISKRAPSPRGRLEPGPSRGDDRGGEGGHLRRPAVSTAPSAAHRSARRCREAARLGSVPETARGADRHVQGRLHVRDCGGYAAMGRLSTRLRDGEHISGSAS